MPFTGTFWTSKELQELFKVSKQRISGIAKEYGWESPFPGVYRDGSSDDGTTVSAYIFARNRAKITGAGRPIWDDTDDMDCPQCGGFAVELPGGYRCIRGHTGR